MVKITSEEANVLLYTFDHLFNVDQAGHVQGVKAPALFPHLHPVWGFDQLKLQELRDKLFAGHEH